MQTNSQRQSGLDFIIQLRAVGEEIQVIGGGGTARKRQFGQRGLGRGEDVIGGQARPNGVKGFEPVKQVGVLGGRDGAGQGLVKVVMGVDQPRQDDVAGQVEHLVGGLGQVGGRPDLLDEAVTDKKATLRNLGLVVVHGGYECIFDEEATHGFLPELRT